MESCRDPFDQTRHDGMRTGGSAMRLECRLDGTSLALECERRDPPLRRNGSSSRGEEMMRKSKPGRTMPLCVDGMTASELENNGGTCAAAGLYNLTGTLSPTGPKRHGGSGRAMRRNQSDGPEQRRWCSDDRFQSDRTDRGRAISPAQRQGMGAQADALSEVSDRVG